VRYWEDTSGSIADPDTGATSETEIADIARQAWPDNTATGDESVKLYHDLSSDLTDAQYTAEANAFTASNCP
jgi:hypothetical protein